MSELREFVVYGTLGLKFWWLLSLLPTPPPPRCEDIPWRAGMVCTIECPGD